MKKTTYFIIQIIWSFVLTFVTCILALTHLKAGADSLEGALAPAGPWLMGGLILYIILTIVYIVIGYKKVKEWRWWVILVSMALAPVSWILACFI